MHYLKHVLVGCFIAIAAALCSIASTTPAAAQNNICSDVTPSSDASNRCANTRFVQGAIGSAPFLITCPTHQFVNTIGALLSICAQPNFTDLAGSIAAGQIPSGSISNAKLAVGAANTIKASLDGVSEIDTGIPNCSLLQYTSGTGFSCATAARIILNAPTTFFVSTAGTDQVGCGLASGASACRTRGYLYNSVLATKYDLGNQLVTVRTDTGGSVTYTDSLQASGPMLLGQSGAAGLIFTGDCSSGHTGDVVIQPANGVGYAYSADGGTSYRVQCQKLDQTSQRANLALGADIVSVGHGSKIYFGNPSLFNVRKDMIFGCNFTNYNAVTLSFAGQAEWDNDYDNDVTSCQVGTTGTPSNGSNVITSVASTTNVVVNMNINATNVPSDAYVLSFVPNTSITMACIYTNPCQANGSPGSESLTLTGGGQDFLDMGNNATAYFNTNGQPDFSIIDTLAGFPFYTSGYFFINEGSTVNAQAITFINPEQGHGRCSTSQAISHIDTNYQGVPYLPCNGQQPEFIQSSVALTAGANTITVASTSGVKIGQVVSDVSAPTATWTAGTFTMTVSSAAGIVAGAHVTGAGILSGAVVTNVSGTTITVGPCGGGARCPSNSPLYISKAGQTVYFTNSLLKGNVVVTFINSGTVFTVSGDSPQGGGAIKGSGTAQNLWFQGNVNNYSVYN